MSDHMIQSRLLGIEYFTESWKKHLKKFLEPMKKAVRKLYNENYKVLSKEKPIVEEEEKDFLDSYLDDLLPTDIDDEYKEYSEDDRMKSAPPNLFHWWDLQHHIPSIRQFAFDHLTILAMCAESEYLVTQNSISTTTAVDSARRFWKH